VIPPRRDQVQVKARLGALSASSPTTRHHGLCARGICREAAGWADDVPLQRLSVEADPETGDVTQLDLPLPRSCIGSASAA
jgi:hypothetical protein